VQPLFTAGATSGPVFEFLVLFGVILLGPIIVKRLGLPGLIGLVLGGFAVGAHGLGLIHAGNQTVPELGHLGLLYLMFVAGLELDLRVLQEYRRAAVALGLLAFAVPGLAGICVGWGLGWSFPAMLLLGALVASHTLIVYPTLRDAGLGDNPAVASAVGATVLTDTLALIVLAVVAGSETDSGSPAFILGQIAVGFAVLIVVALFVLPRLVDTALRYWGADPVARYLVIIVALLLMALLAQVFGIEGIVGAFFAGISLNRLVPNEGPSMERLEFFGTAVFVPVFLVSIGLLLDPSVMFTGEALKLAALICAAALGGKAIACWLAGSLLKFSRPERAAMYVLTAPQAAATLAVTLIGFEIGLFGTTVVNAVLVLILVSIVAAALLTEKVIEWMPARAAGTPPLGAKILVITSSTGPTDAAVRASTLLARPDGGHSDLLIARSPTEPPLDAARRREVERGIHRQGFDGRFRTAVDSLADAVTKALLAGDHSLVIVDDPTFDTAPGRVPVLVVDGITSTRKAVLLVDADGDSDGLAAEIGRRLATDARGNRLLRRLSGSAGDGPDGVTVRGVDSD
jgi:Kef-type K+ transport system membrane component KefB